MDDRWKADVQLYRIPRESEDKRIRSVEVRPSTFHPFPSSHPRRPNNTQGQQPPNWGSSSSQQPSAQGSPNPASYPNYYAETPASQPVDRHAASQAYAPYYAGATRAQAQGADDDGWQQVAARGRPTEQKPVAAPEVKGYDIGACHIAFTAWRRSG